MMIATYKIQDGIRYLLINERVQPFGGKLGNRKACYVDATKRINEAIDNNETTAIVAGVLGNYKVDLQPIITSMQERPNGIPAQCKITFIEE